MALPLEKKTLFQMITKKAQMASDHLKINISLKVVLKVALFEKVEVFVNSLL